MNKLSVAVLAVIIAALTVACASEAEEGEDEEERTTSSNLSRRSDAGARSGNGEQRVAAGYGDIRTYNDCMKRTSGAECWRVFTAAAKR